ncbi:hypothetical protein [Phenylobacterium sp.]|jgi:hypothetical protein|uniref:hypothetical protein n=1 Tax=Phenylobacterium sp. TaxID=1871053 RepID=UPI002E2FC0FD|nr:hypothetical protein [Phenylobacterium sp.]HEX2559976.1 hypothetical protein [Phenylobacterium sp.]
MIESKGEGRIIPLEAASGVAGRLPYAIELWNLPRTAPERIVGRAASAVLARAIFQAAMSEHLGRKLILRRGSRVVAETE